VNERKIKKSIANRQGQAGIEKHLYLKIFGQTSYEAGTEHLKKQDSMA